MCQTMALPEVNARVTDDPAAVDAFAEQMVDVLNKGSLAIMISVGHRTGLFDAMAGLPPSSSHAIAGAADLNERYVREWLGAMVTGGFVDYDPETRHYSLPAAHAACLTRAATPDNLAAFAQYIPVLGQVEDEVIACFRNGGGVPYERYPRFHAVMAEDSGQTVLGGLFEHILPLVPGLHERLSSGIDVLDLGCGRGRALLALAEAYPASRFTGYDFCEEPIDWARAQAAERGLVNVRFDVVDAARLDEVKRYDLITTFDAIHDQRAPASVLANIARALRDDGVYLMQDIKASSDLHNNTDHLIGPFLYTISTMHCMTVSLAQGGAGLGTMWGRETALRMLREAGFGEVLVEELDHDIQNDFYVVRK